jgi:hypothetical protein
MVTEVLRLGLGDKGDVLYDLLSQVDCLTCTIVQDYIQVFQSRIVHGSQRMCSTSQGHRFLYRGFFLG